MIHRKSLENAENYEDGETWRLRQGSLKGSLVGGLPLAQFFAPVFCHQDGDDDSDDDDDGDDDDDDDDDDNHDDVGYHVC